MTCFLKLWVGILEENSKRWGGGCLLLNPPLFHVGHSASCEVQHVEKSTPDFNTLINQPVINNSDKVDNYYTQDKWGINFCFINSLHI